MDKEASIMSHILCVAEKEGGRDLHKFIRS
jgi:hypothetical protein